MTGSSQRRQRPLPGIKQVLELIALAALVRTLFYAAVDAFAAHLFGDPRPGRSGSGRVVSVARPPAAEDPGRSSTPNRPLPRSRVA